MVRTRSVPYLAVALGAGSLVPLVFVVAASAFPSGLEGSEWEARVEAHAAELVVDGREAFRHGPSGDWALWSQEVRLELALSKLLPADALELGLKVDSDALSQRFVADFRRRAVDLESHGTMLELLRSQAIVGVTARFDETGRLAAVGLQCALCHSTVDDAIAPGVGRRLDGWANRDLDFGAVLALAPQLGPVQELAGGDAEHVRALLRGFGPGRFDGELGANGALAPLIPPVFGLAGSGRSGSTHWDEFVARLGERVDDDFLRTRLAAGRTPAARGALEAYQLALPTPAPPPGSYDLDDADRGAELFSGRARCAECHPPPLLGAVRRTGGDAALAPEATPLRALWTRTRGGFYRDGRFANLREVVEHYDRELALGLAEDERGDLVQFLLSL